MPICLEDVEEQYGLPEPEPERLARVYDEHTKAA
jgi:hypothetical protein